MSTPERLRPPDGQPVPLARTAPSTNTAESSEYTSEGELMSSAVATVSVLEEGEMRGEDFHMRGSQQQAAMRGDGAETIEAESARECRNARSDIQALTKSMRVARIATHEEAPQDQGVVEEATRRDLQESAQMFSWRTVEQLYTSLLDARDRHITTAETKAAQGEICAGDRPVKMSTENLNMLERFPSLILRYGDQQEREQKMRALNREVFLKKNRETREKAAVDLMQLIDPPPQLRYTEQDAMQIFKEGRTIGYYDSQIHDDLKCVLLESYGVQPPEGFEERIRCLRDSEDKNHPSKRGHEAARLLSAAYWAKELQDPALDTRVFKAAQLGTPHLLLVSDEKRRSNFWRAFNERLLELGEEPFQRRERMRAQGR